MCNFTDKAVHVSKQEQLQDHRNVNKFITSSQDTIVLVLNISNNKPECT